MLTPARLVPHIFAMTVGLAALHAPSVIGQTMTLTVPYRGALSMQTAATTVEFDASAIAAGATIRIGGGTCPTVDDPADACVPVAASSCAGAACSAFGVTAGGDDIAVKRISGTNRAQLTLTYLGSFGANYCSYIGPALAKTFDVTLTGFTFAAATNGYRISSFMAPSDASCDIAYARVPGPRPSFPSGSPISKLGRLPLNIVLVIDKSPSMGWTIPGSTDIRWDRMKSSAQLFAAVWDVVGAPSLPATVSSEGHAEDRLGLVFFGGTASEAPLDGSSFFKQRGTSTSPWTTPVTDALNATSFTGGTSVGAGTANARTRLNSVASVNGDTAIVLFTDGEQNTPPCIIRVGETTTPTTKPYPGLPGVTYVDQCTVAASAPPSALLTLSGSVLARDVLPRGPIFTIGLGEGGMAASAVLLDEISQETAGRPWFPNNGVAMDTSFVDSLVDNLKGGTVSMLERTLSVVPAGAAAGTPMTVSVDPSLTRVAFVLSWDRAAQEVTLEIRRPDGTVVVPPLSRGNANSRVAAVNLPANGPSGDWQARVVRHSGIKAPLNYQLTAFGVESRLSSRITESPRVGTGQPIKIVAEIGWDDEGLADLPPGAIRATIERPQENLGTILHQSVIKDPLPARVDTSPLMMKIDQLARTANLFAKIEPRALPDSVQLKSMGQGRYEATFDGANVGGTYRIRVDFDWNDSRTGRIKRKQIAERQVAVLPSADGSLVEVRRDLKLRQALVLVTPRDRFGNYVGPGHESQFNVQVEGQPAIVPVSDPNVSGTYAIRLAGLAPNANPRIKIGFREQTLRDAPVSRLERPDESGGIDKWPWWAWLLAILLLALLIVLIWKMLWN